MSVEECLSKCVDDYECMALTYKVRLYNKSIVLISKKNHLLLMKGTFIIIEIIVYHERDIQFVSYITVLDSQYLSRLPALAPSK